MMKKTPSTNTFYEFFCPVKIIAGNHSLEHLAFELTSLNATNPMILTDKGINNIGLITPVTDSLQQGGITVKTIFDDVPPDSSLQVVQEATKIYRDNHCDAIVAVGGGSVIDTAKMVNVLVSEGGDDLTAYAGAHNLPNPLKPFIIIPTTAGTGSEVTIAAVISDTDKNVKTLYASYHLLPNATIIDPRMTMTLPPHITAMTGMDAMTHAIEAFTCMAKNPISDAYATSAIKKISNNLLYVLDNPSDTQARLELAQAATMAGIAFSNSTVGVVHSLGHALGAVAHLPHGVCMSLFLPYVLEYNKESIAQTLAELLLPLAGAEEYSRTAPVDRAEATIAYIRNLRDTLYDKTQLPRTLQETGKVSEAMFDEIAEKALDDGSIIFNPKEATKADLLDILNKAWC